MTGDAGLKGVTMGGGDAPCGSTGGPVLMPDVVQVGVSRHAHMQNRLGSVAASGRRPLNRGRLMETSVFATAPVLSSPSD